LANMTLAANHLALFSPTCCSSHRQHDIEAFDLVKKSSRAPFKYPFNLPQFNRRP
jgi:hypothetical protein